MKRQAPVTRGVFMAAFIALSVIAEEHCSRREYRRSSVGAILKGALDDDGDAKAAMLFLEGAIAWP
jgi:hypothetical protein